MWSPPWPSDRHAHVAKPEAYVYTPPVQAAPDITKQSGRLRGDKTRRERRTQVSDFFDVSVLLLARDLKFTKSRLREPFLAARCVGSVHGAVSACFFWRGMYRIYTCMLGNLLTKLPYLVFVSAVKLCAGCLIANAADNSTGVPPFI